MEKFDELEQALDEVSSYIDSLTAENEQLKSDIAGLKNTLEDRNAEIAQLQQEVQSTSVKANASIESNTAYQKRAEGLLARVRAMQQKRASEQPAEENNSTSEFPHQLSLLDD